MNPVILIAPDLSLLTPISGPVYHIIVLKLLQDLQCGYNIVTSLFFRFFAKTFYSSRGL